VNRLGGSIEIDCWRDRGAQKSNGVEASGNCGEYSGPHIRKVRASIKNKKGKMTLGGEKSSRWALQSGHRIRIKKMGQHTSKIITAWGAIEEKHTPDIDFYANGADKLA